MFLTGFTSLYLHIFIVLATTYCNAGFYNCTQDFAYFRPKDFKFQIIKNRAVNENQVVRKTNVLITLCKNTSKG